MSNRNAPRLQGDRYQHLYSWLKILDLLDPHKGIAYVTVEDSEAGSADDVTVYSTDEAIPLLFFQVKWHVDHRTTYSFENFRDYLLIKLWNTWRDLREAHSDRSIEIWLVSNWNPDKRLGKAIDAKTNRLKSSILHQPSKDILDWQNLLEVDDEDFLSFCGALHFELGFYSLEKMEQEVKKQMRHYKLKHDDMALSLVRDRVSKWIEYGKNQITRKDLEEFVDRHNLEDRSSCTIAFQTWQKETHELEPAYEIDWSQQFRRDSRKVPVAEEWVTLLQELRSIADKIRANKTCDIIHLMSSSICLSAAFAFGHVFSLASNVQVEFHHRDQIWNSNRPFTTETVISVESELLNEHAEDLLLIVSITGDAESAVKAYVENSGLNPKAYAIITPISEPNSFSVENNEHACAIANQIRTALRQAREEFATATTHFFYFGPASLAILIGRLINACGPVQIYEHQNPGYVPTCLLR